MFNIGEVVVYNQLVCKIKEVKNTSRGDYFVLEPVDDATLVISVPVDNKAGTMRKIMPEEEARELISKIPSIPTLNIGDKYIEQKYKDLMKSNNKEDLITVIKTTYIRNELRKNNNKKISEKDDTYFRRAEKLLYNELAYSLSMTYDEIKDYINRYCEVK